MMIKKKFSSVKKLAEESDYKKEIWGIARMDDVESMFFLHLLR